jgi:histidinol-phosphate phosphatase family protein
MALRAVAHLAAEPTAAPPGAPAPGLLLCCVGTGPAESRLRVLTHELGIKEHVIWAGARRDAHRHVAAADVALFPAVPAGARWALLDALAWGTPVVAADSPGARSLLDAGAARLVSPEDPAALARTLGALLQDPAEAARLAERGRARVAARASRRVFGIDLECLVLAHLVARIPRGSGRRPAVLLDRDGTVVRDVPYNADPAAVVLEPDAGRAIGWMRDAGFEVVVVSNQSAVARGLCSEADVRAVNERVQSLLQAEGAGVDAFYFCPHHPERGDACDCRKPEPGLLLRAARERGLDLGKSFLVGDSERDLEAGRRAGVRSLAYGGTGWLALARDILGLAWQARGA